VEIYLQLILSNRLKLHLEGGAAYRIAQKCLTEFLTIGGVVTVCFHSVTLCQAGSVDGTSDDGFHVNTILQAFLVDTAHPGRSVLDCFSFDQSSLIGMDNRNISDCHNLILLLLINKVFDV
jgi:hypothetical protein